MSKNSGCFLGCVIKVEWTQTLNLKYFEFTLIQNREKLLILIFEEVELANILHLC